MQQLAQDIANRTFKRCYLLYGDEDYLRKQYRDRLLQALIPEGDTMNYNRFNGKDINVGEIIDQAETLPFFADNRIIHIEDSGLCKSGGEQLAEYIQSIPESTILIINESEVDKRSKLFKAVTGGGRAVEFMRQPEETLKKWILTRVKKENKLIDARAVDTLLERTGNDMTTISVELEKLFSYAYDKEAISEKDVTEIVTVSTGNKVFDMIAAMADRKQAAALEMYHDLLAHKETPFGILALIGRQFNLMLQVKELKEEGYGSRQIADKVGMTSYVVQKYEKQAAGFSSSRIRQALEACVIADENVKIRGMNPELCVELLIIEYSE